MGRRGRSTIKTVEAYYKARVATMPGWATGGQGPGGAAAGNTKWVFDVVSVRGQDPKERVIMAPQGTAEDFEAKGVTAETLIAYGYDLPWTQGMTVSRDPRYLYHPHSPTLIGDPSWVSSEQFDMVAKADPATVEEWNRLPPDQQQGRLREMMLAMLGDRFQLRVHTEKRDMPAYALVVAKGGPKIRPLTGQPPTFNDGSDPSKPYQSPWDGSDLGQIKGHGVTIDGLAAELWAKRELGSKKVIDQTGLTGIYDFTLKWTPEGDPDDAGGVSLITAIQEQLGLKLEPVKVPMDVVVIDHVERPSPN